MVRTKKKEKKFGACIVWWNKDLGEKLPESRNYRSTRLNELELERVCAGRKKTTENHKHRNFLEARDQNFR